MSGIGHWDSEPESWSRNGTYLAKKKYRYYTQKRILSHIFETGGYWRLQLEKMSFSWVPISVL